MLLYEEETRKIINACMTVHRELGNGFLEAVYQEALAIEFREHGIPFIREANIRICYKKHVLNKEYFADFICYGKIIVELKCVSRLLNVNKAQVLNYLHGTKLQVGLLFNFGEASLKWEHLTLFSNEQQPITPFPPPVFVAGAPPVYQPTNAIANTVRCEQIRLSEWI